MESLEGNPRGLPKDGQAARGIRRGRTGRGPGLIRPPSPTPMDRCNPMYNPLELTGRVRRLGRPAECRVLIVGDRRDRRRLTLCLSQGPWAGLPVVGFVDAGHP